MYTIIVLLAGLWGILLGGTPATLLASDHNPPQNTQQNSQEENSSNDSIVLPESIQKKLDDPNFDTRFEKGVLQPWHDFKSYYPRRTIPQSSLT